MRKKLLSVLLCTAMAATLLTGCGGSDSNGGSTGGSNKGGSSAEATKAVVSDDGKTLNIRVWNEEFKTRVVDNYPGYEKVDDNSGKIGDVAVKWITTSNQDNAYQNALDEELLKQESASADDKIDIFLIEADYALKYVNSGYSLDIVNDLGVSESALANQFKYTKDVVTDSDGKLKGASWQACPAGLIYRRDIAKKVFGSDDPEKVQENFKDWDAFKESAKKLKDAGYVVTPSVNDPYRVFSNNVSSKWVENSKINVDANIKAWADLGKELVDAGETNTYDLWSDEWTAAGATQKGNAFCYFGPAWLFDFSLGGDVADNGLFGLCEGPQSFFWGGTWVCAANYTDNQSLVKDIIEKMTGDADVLSSVVKKNNDFVNNSEVMKTFETDKSFGDKILGGQNPIPIFNKGVGNIDLSNITAYDQACNEEFQNAMKEYFEGKVSYDEALEAFYKAVETKHPELSH